MSPLRYVGGFCWRFVLAYGLLIAPWPGWNAAYGSWFRALNQSVFVSDGQRLLRFEAAKDVRVPMDTLIELANRARGDGSGNLAGMRLLLDSRGVGWIPSALFIALTLASPVGWRRRAWALALGFVLIHVYIVFSVGCFIWNQSAGIGLVALPPFLKAVVAGLEETMVIQLGASFVVPVVIWAVVTFRVLDIGRIFSNEDPQRAPSRGTTT
jgi:hypothetical protein